MSSPSDVKHEFEDDLLEIVDNLKQEEQTTEDTSNHHIQSVQFNCHNFVNVSDDAEADIKTENEDEDPLGLVDDSKQKEISFK